MISYDKLFKQLKNQGISTYFLRQNRIIGESTLTKLRNNEPVSITTIDRLCNLLNCQPGDLLTHVPEKRKGDGK